MHLDVPLQIPPLCFSQAWHHRYDVDGVHQWLRRCVRETVAQRSPTDPIHKLILDPVPNHREPAGLVREQVLRCIVPGVTATQPTNLDDLTNAWPLIDTMGTARTRISQLT
jgi:hypothetical protein